MVVRQAPVPFFEFYLSLQLFCSLFLLSAFRCVYLSPKRRTESIQAKLVSADELDPSLGGALMLTATSTYFITHFYIRISV